MDDHLDLLLQDIRRSGDRATTSDGSSPETTAISDSMSDKDESCENQKPISRGRRRGMETVWNKLDF